MDYRSPSIGTIALLSLSNFAFGPALGGLADRSRDTP